MNPHLAYPGLFYYYDTDVSRYVPCYDFQFETGNDTRLDRWLTEDIMSYYANLRNRILGTLLGQIDFGKVLDYDGKRYMIVSSIYNIKKSFNEVTCLEISEGITSGSFIELEDGSGYVLLEDGNKIIP